MCENCQQLQARVAGMQAAIQRIIDIERNENPEEDPEADPLGLIALGRDALGTDPSPMLEVVRAARDVKNAFEADLRGDDWWNTIIALRDAVDNLDEQQPGVWNK
jgi:hypothetical protein